MARKSDSRGPRRDLTLEVITPGGKVFFGSVLSLVFPGVDGFLGVLPGHAPMVALVGPEVVRFSRPSGPELRMAVSGGFAEVRGNRVVLTVEAAERGDQIDLDRALCSCRRAEERLAGRGREPEVDVLRAELSLRRAFARIHAARPGMRIEEARSQG